MKKLMTMIAAVAMSFGLFADATPALQTSFEAGDPGVNDTTLALSDAGWTGLTAETLELGVYTREKPAYVYDTTGANVRREAFSAKGDNLQFLNLETGKATLSHEAGSGAKVIDQLVQFTGFEEDVELANDDETTKIAVWLKAVEADDTATEPVAGETNLYVTVGTGADVTTVVIDPASVGLEAFEPDAWYRLTIKTIGDVIEAGKGVEFTQDGFVIYINGKQASILGKTPYHTYGAQLNATAKGLYANGQLFTAVAKGAANEIASVGFTGIGGADDILADADGPEFCQAVNVTIAPILGAEIEVTAGGVKIAGTDNVYLIPQGAYTVTYTAADGYILDMKTIDHNTSEGTPIDDSKDVKPQLVIVEVKYDGGQAVPYASADAALAAVEAYQKGKVGTVIVVEFKQGATNELAYAFDKGTIINISDDSEETPEQISSLWSITKGNVSQLTGIGNYKVVYFDYDPENEEAQSAYTLTFAGAMGEGSAIYAQNITADADSITLDPASSIRTKADLSDAFVDVPGYKLVADADEDTGWTSYFLEAIEYAVTLSYEDSGVVKTESFEDPAAALVRLQELAAQYDSVSATFLKEVTLQGFTFAADAVLTVGEGGSWSVIGDVTAPAIEKEKSVTVQDTAEVTSTLTLNGNIFVGDRAEKETFVQADGLVLGADVTVGSQTPGFEANGKATLVIGQRFNADDHKLTLTLNGKVEYFGETSIKSVFTDAPEGYFLKEETVVGHFVYTLEPIPTYTLAVTTPDPTEGTLSTDPAAGDIEAGTTVKVTATPADGYELEAITTNGQALAANSFEMPAENVTVAATFKKTSTDPVDGKLDDDGKANLDTLKKALPDGTDINAWAGKIYESGKIPAAQLNKTTPALIAVSVAYDLPIVTVMPTVTVAATESTEGAPAFRFTVAADVNIDLAKAAVQKIVKYSADLATDEFDASTAAEVNITTTPGSNVMTAEFVKGPAKGFMKADFTVAE